MDIRPVGSAELAAVDTMLTAAYRADGFPSSGFAPSLRLLDGLRGATLLAGWIAERPVAAGAILDHGGFAQIGLVGVDTAHRGRGLARTIMGALLHRVPPGRPLLLDATPSGAPLYRKLGFAGLDAVRVWNGVPGRARPEAAPLAPADLPEVQAFDRAVFGVDRGPILRSLLAEAGVRGAVCRNGGRLSGYAMLRGARLGPWLAETPEAAAALLQADWPGTLSALVPDANRGATALLEQAGLRAGQVLQHMGRHTAGARLPDRSAIYGQINFHLG